MGYPTHIDYAVGAKGPDLVMQVNEPDGSAKDGTGATTIKFYVYDLDAESYIVNGNTDGVTLHQANPMQLKRVLQTGDTQNEIKNAVAFFSWELNSKLEFSTCINFTVSQPYKRMTQ